MKVGENVFVDTGAWVALAIVRDALHPRALLAWDELMRSGARLLTSVAVIVETFTYLQRKGSPELARAWRESLYQAPRLRVLDCAAGDLAAAWHAVDDKTFHRLGIVDALSFVLMRRHKVRKAFAFDTHFAVAGFEIVG